jgi:hypothetical protein
MRKRNFFKLNLFKIDCPGIIAVRDSSQAQKDKLPEFNRINKKKPANHKICRLLVFVDPVFVGAAGFEPATSCSQSRHTNRAVLRPEWRREGDSNPRYGITRTPV